VLWAPFSWGGGWDRKPGVWGRKGVSPRDVWEASFCGCDHQLGECKRGQTACRGGTTQGPQLVSMAGWGITPAPVFSLP
jgi:hypothetical protein